MDQSSKVRYSDILRNLAGFDDWLTGLGVPVRQSDRAHSSIRILEKAQHAFLNELDGVEAGVSNAEYLFCLTEALELHDVYLAFRDHPPAQLRTAMKRALSGPVLPEAETDKNREGRNIMFEMALGAEWALLGARVDLLEPDLVVSLPNRTYLVACKRPEHEDGVGRAVKDAARQLRKALSKAPDSHFGLVAISFSRILNRGNKFFSGSEDSLSALLNEQMISLRPTWRAAKFHPRSIAIAFHCHTPADWGQGLFRMSTMRVGPAADRDEVVHQDLRADLESLYSNALKV